MPQPGRLLGRESLGVGGKVAHAFRGPGPDRGGVEHTHVGPVALAQITPSHETEDVGRLARELAHGRFERHHRAIAHPSSEEVRRQRRVAQLVDVRAGVGEAEHDLLVRKQPAYIADIVVGDVRTKARAEIFGDRDLAHHVERAAAALAREVADASPLQFGELLRLRDFEGVPPRLHRRFFEIGGCERRATPDRDMRRGERRGSPSSARRTPGRC